MEEKIVHRVESWMNPKEILCTTYQMRDFYTQFRDGFFSSLDVMNYIQHYKVAELLRKGDNVLDMCCGRSLMLPFIYYYKKNINAYTGVDICESNIRNGYGKKKKYPFKTCFEIINVAHIDRIIPDNCMDFIIYTSSIEHMQKEQGIKSLVNAYKILKNTGTMFLSCPNTLHKKNPYDTQYKAHLYEWDLKELSGQVENIGFNIINVWGLVAKKREFDKWIVHQQENTIDMYQKLKKYLPTKFLMCFMPILFPDIACEVGLLLNKKNKKSYLI